MSVPRTPVPIARAGGILDWLLRATAVVFLLSAARWFWTSRDAVVDLVARTGASTLLLSLALAALHMLALAGCWLYLLPADTRAGSSVALCRAFTVGWIARYVPGKIWAYAVRVFLAQRIGLAVRLTLGSSAAEYGITMVVAALLALPLLEFRVISGTGLLIIVFVVLSLCTLLASTLRRFVLPALLAVVSMTALGGVTAALMVGGGHADLVDVPWLIAASTLAWLAGTLAIVTPAGIGVREIALVELLRGLASPSDAAGVALLTRAVSLLADLTVAALIFGTLPHSPRRLTAVIGAPKAPLDVFKQLPVDCDLVGKQSKRNEEEPCASEQ